METAEREPRRCCRHYCLQPSLAARRIMIAWHRWLVTKAPPGESCTVERFPIRQYGPSVGCVCFARPAAWTKERVHMRRTQVAALVAGTALGLAGVTLGVVLS